MKLQRVYFLEFWFVNNGTKWNWSYPTWRSNDIEKDIQDYLETKQLPFEELTIADIKYKYKEISN